MHPDAANRWVDQERARTDRDQARLRTRLAQLDADCHRCNYDTHACPGCGAPLPHGTEVCADCKNL